MNSNPFNLCPTCIYNTSCVLTDQKSQVWSCSEYDEAAEINDASPEPIKSITTKQEPKMAMV